MNFAKGPRFILQISWVLRIWGVFIVISGQTSPLIWPADQALPHYPAASLPLMVVDVDHLNAAQIALLGSLQGLFNSTVAGGEASPVKKSLYIERSSTEGKYNWLKTLNIPYQEKTFNEVLDLYLPHLKRALVYDPAFPLTLNLATHLAARRNAVVVDPALADFLKSKSPGIDINSGLIGKYKNKYELNRRLIEEIQKQSNHPPRLLLSLTPRIGDGIRELAYALNLDAFVLYMTLIPENVPDPKASPVDGREKAQMAEFAKYLGPHTLAQGFYEGEVRSIRNMSEHKIPTIVGTSYNNYSIWSSLREPIVLQKTLEAPSEAIEKKLYLNLVMSDGDNMSYVQHFVKDVFDKWSGRGRYPINWTIAPGLIDAGPKIFNHFMKVATPNDYFISGPSGLGYFHPEKWGRASSSEGSEKNRQEFESYWEKTGNYLRASGLRVIDISNDHKRLSDEVGAVIRKHNPELLGLLNDKVGDPPGPERNYLLNDDLPVSSMERSLTSADDFRQTLHAALADLEQGENPVFLSITIDAWKKDKEHGYNFVNTVLDEAQNAGHPVKALRSDEFFHMLRKHLLSQKKKGALVDPRCKVFGQ